MLTRIWLALALLSCADAALGAPRSPSRLVGNEETMEGVGKRILRRRQDGEERASAIRSLGLAAGSLSHPAAGGEVAAGSSEDLAKAALAASVEAALKRRGFAVKRVPGPAGESWAEDWRQVALLDDAVGVAILEATWQEWYPAKAASFEYGLGDLTSLLNEQGVDALLFVSAGGKTASGPFSAFFGPPWPVVVIQLSLVDRSGEVLWFEFFASANHYDLRDRRVVDDLLRHLFEDFPGAKP